MQGSASSDPTVEDRPDGEAVERDKSEQKPQNAQQKLLLPRAELLQPAEACMHLLRFEATWRSAEQGPLPDYEEPKCRQAEPDEKIGLPVSTNRAKFEINKNS